MFNPFRILGDVFHVVSILILIHSIQTSRSATGISLKTQSLYMLVYVTRYLDLLTFSFGSIYNVLMKLIFLSSTAYTIHITKKYTKSMTQYVDDFNLLYVLVPSSILALLFNYKFTIFEILWSFSLWLESVAILPQLYMLQRQGQGDLLTVHYIFALGCYRALYIPNWIYRYATESKFDYVSILTGIIQTLIYSDFFYIYYDKVIKSIKLPQ
ncbi:Erd2 protein [Martiniozyma asiatica (nom. inval.)]|nr:Erd2 protein [Martiniozyma asiatica]